METTSRTTAPSMAPSTKDPPSAEDESQRMERSAGVDGEGESQPRKRLLHLDWLRTQSVWNVVCGHAWWTAVDEASRTNANCDPTCSILATEGERMIDYTVDQGTLHTVPLFFLVSGILASGSIARSPGFGKFALRRLARLLPPFITGGIALFIFRAAVGDVESIDDIILSHLWFLWALALVQIGTYPCVRAYQSARRGEAYALLMALFAIPIGLLLLVGGLLFDKLTDGGNRGLWMAVIPFASVLALLCLVTARSLEVRGHSKGIVGAAVVGALAILAVATLLLAVPKPDTEEDEYDWVQVNLFAGVVQIILFYLFGAIAADCSEDLVNFFAAIPAGTIPVAVLLLSSYWPFFTFWAEKTVRRNAFLITFTDDAQRLWGIVRGWAWIAAMWWLAKTACEHVIHPLVFTHVTQSAMVVFIFHRAFEALWVEALPSTSNGVALCFQLIVLNFLGCIAIYALLVLNKWTRFAFGITLAKPEGVAPSKTLVQ